jgi:hypothetical protein
VIAVVHLVWGPLGTTSLRDFVASYRRSEAGVEHELVVLFNGVGDDQLPAFEAELEGVAHRPLRLAEPVQDLAAYRQAVALLDHRRICVLNSHSRIRAAGWLSALEAALSSRGVGLVGASGSWASMRSYALYHVGLPSAYQSVWPDRRATLEQFRALDQERTGVPVERGVLRHLHTARALAGMTIGFPSFPAEHLRTNAFMAERQLLAHALRRSPRRKVDAHRMESGVNGLTRRVQKSGLRAVVVDRFARSFEVEEWPDSETFWQGEQGGLLVADNQTEDYQRASPTRRRLLAGYAWGERAAPSPAMR